jgi:hypothetical protein
MATRPTPGRRRHLGRLYAPWSWKLLRQLLLDLLVLSWCVAWWLVGRATDALFLGMAGIAHGTADTSGQLQRQVDAAAQAAGQVPLAGESLRAPLDAASQSIGRLAGSSGDLATQLEQLALVLGWGGFLLPVLLVVPFWLRHRVRFWLDSAAIAELMASGADDELLAVRSLVNQPMRRLVALAPDPASAWRAGDKDVIAALADLERRRRGLPRAKRRRRPTLPAPPEPA